jgi:hypothetical protein
VGGIVFFAAHGVSVIFRDARVDDPAGLGAITLFAITTVLTAIGFIVAGVAAAHPLPNVCSSRRWPTRRSLRR